MLLNGTKLFGRVSTATFLLLTATVIKMTSNEYQSCIRAKNDAGHMTYSGFGKGNLEKLVGYSQASSGGVCILYMGNRHFGASWPFCSDLTIVVNDKCIDSCSTGFVPTLKVKVLLWREAGVCRWPQRATNVITSTRPTDSIFHLLLQSIFHYKVKLTQISVVIIVLSRPLHKNTCPFLIWKFLLMANLIWELIILISASKCLSSCTYCKRSLLQGFKYHWPEGLIVPAKRKHCCNRGHK